jgi:hypothetical protein
MFKTIKWNTDSAAVQRFRNTRKAIQESRKKQKKNKSSSSQAGGPAPKESGCKQVDKSTSSRIL